MKILHLQQGSEEWLAARAGVITASRFTDARSKLSRASKNGAAGDMSGTALDYAWTIVMERISGHPLDDTFVTWQMKRGTELEPAARMEYETLTGAFVSESGIALTDDGSFGYSTDGLVDDDGLVEIKCPAACQKIGAIWSHPETAEAEYIDQMQGGMWITGRQWCDLVVYCPWLESVGKQLFVKRIERNEEYIETLETDLMAFKTLVDKYESILRYAA